MSAPVGLPPQQAEATRDWPHAVIGCAARTAADRDGTSRRTTRTTLGDRPALHVEPDNGSRAGTILYFHGGGFVFGSPDTALSLTGHVVPKTGFCAYSLDYRLAPEHPFPAAIEDTLCAYREILESGIEPSTIAFAGDSPGGGLTVTTCLAARDTGLPLPAAIVAFSPGLDATRTGESMHGTVLKFVGLAWCDPIGMDRGPCWEGSRWALRTSRAPTRTSTRCRRGRSWHEQWPNRTGIWPRA